MHALQVEGIPAFNDNYIWCIHNQQQAIIVDPGSAKDVQRFLDLHQLSLDAILVTHHHPDHIGGLKTLKQAHNCTVYGFAGAQYQPIDTRVSEGDSLTLLGLQIDVLEVPGHTLDHIAFVARPTGLAPWLFCGDTLFSGGCGRLFEGTPAQMHASLDKLRCLPSNTQVFCAHEYTLANLSFARHYNPSNEALATYQQHCIARRADDQATIPTTLEIERAINPFLRVFDSDIHQQLNEQLGLALTQDTPPADLFAAIRQAKDTF